MKKGLLLFTTFLLFLFPLLGQNQNRKFLKLTQSDFYFLPASEGGYHLFIRRKYGIESVMLVESNKDPSGKKTNYAYRALEYNPINGDEVRMLDGKVLNSKDSKYSLIDSSAEKNAAFGQAFHIYIPNKIVYGYPWSRNGQVELDKDFIAQKKEFFVNIRSFGKKFADYSGGFLDNPFSISLEEGKLPQRPQKAPETSAYDDEESGFAPSLSSSDQEIDSLLNQPESYSDYNSDYTDEENSDYSDYALEASSDYSYDSSDYGAYDSSSESYDAYSDYSEDEDYSYLTPDDKDSEAYQAVKTVDNTALDSPASSPYDENSTSAKAAYKASAVKETSEIEASPVPQDPYAESMQGVDKEAMEALINSEPVTETKLPGKTSKKKNSTEEKINPFGEDYYIGYDGIKFIYGQGRGKISDLYVSETEVNQACYERIMGENPSSNPGPKMPVDNISYYDAIYFCNKLSLREGRTPCYALKGETDIKKWGTVPKARSTLWASLTCNFEADGYRLLTVEEWEFFASGGVNREGGKYAGNREIEYVAWYLDNSGESSAPCALKEKNSCGLYDMCGNLAEYVYGSSGDKEKTAALKGGSFLSDAKTCQTKTTSATNPWLAEATNGLRICRRAE